MASAALKFSVRRMSPAVSFCTARAISAAHGLWAPRTPTRARGVAAEGHASIQPWGYPSPVAPTALAAATPRRSRGSPASAGANGEHREEEGDVWPPKTPLRAGHRAGLHRALWGRCAEGTHPRAAWGGETHHVGLAQETRGVWPGWRVLLRAGFGSAEQTRSWGKGGAAVDCGRGSWGAQRPAPSTPAPKDASV